MTGRSCLFAVLIGGTVLYIQGNLAGQNAEPERPRGRSSAARLTAEQAGELERRIDQTVHERGVLESANTADVRCEVQGETTILTLIAEGTAVTKGDLLVELDDAALEEQRLQQRIAVAQARAAVAQAEAAVEAAERRGEAARQSAGSARHLAGLALKQYLGEGGELALETAKAERAVALAEQRLEVAEAKAARIADLVQRKAMSKTEARDAELAVAEAQAELAIAEGAKRLLADYTSKYRAAALEHAVVQAHAALDESRYAARAALDAATAELRARKAMLELEQAKLDRLERQIENCRIVAPHDGIVLYAAASTRRAAATAIEPGATVRERQPLLRILDPDQLRVRVRVHESRIGRIRPGQPVALRFDALPDRPLTGTVAEIANAPEPGSWPNADVVSYSVFVTLDEPPPELKLGMTALAEIDVTAAKSDE